MCKVMGCKQLHQRHHCRVCKNNDSNHRSSECPKGTMIYHGTKKQYANLIQQNGFRPSQQGRIGSGVYFTFDFDQAKQIARYRYSNSKPVVIECLAEVDYRQFDKNDSEEEILRKLDEWYKFCKSTAKQGVHPPWANNGEFKQVCVKDHRAICIKRVYDV